MCRVWHLTRSMPRTPYVHCAVVSCRGRPPDSAVCRCRRSPPALAVCRRCNIRAAGVGAAPVNGRIDLTAACASAESWCRDNTTASRAKQPPLIVQTLSTRLLTRQAEVRLFWLACCGWRVAVGVLRLACCGWRFAVGVLRLAFCGWRFKFVVLRLAFCVCLLLLAFCGWPFAVGVLHLSFCWWRFAVDDFAVGSL